MSEHKHDLIIIGGGPAGLSAAIYATRALLDAVVFEQGGFGGQIVQTDEIDNYPGIAKASGYELGEAFRAHAEGLGAQFAYDQITSIQTIDPQAHDGYRFVLKDSSDEDWYAKAVILASGATPRHVGFEGEDTFAGRGVSYCATCDAMFFRGKKVYVVGGGNTACQEALYLTDFASEVIQLVRKDHVRAQAVVAERLAQSSVELRYNTELVKMEGEGAFATSVTLLNNKTGETYVEQGEPASFGVFVFVGTNPTSSLVEGLVDLQGNAIVTDETMATKTEGLYAAGDVRNTPLRQVVTAAADGAVAATYANKLIRGLAE
jgi:thioredoxin reductase (NADPH)